MEPVAFGGANDRFVPGYAFETSPVGQIRTRVLSSENKKDPPPLLLRAKGMGSQWIIGGFPARWQIAKLPRFR